MKSMVRRVLVGGLLLLGVVCGSVIAWFMINESSLVFPGQARTDTTFPPRDAAEFPWDSLRVRAEDGTLTFLVESRLPENLGGRWVIFFHGNGMLVSDSGGRYEWLREAGFNILAVELRGYGASASAGPAEEQGTYQDARAAWTYLTETVGVSSDSIVVYGFSLGSGLATHIAAHADVAGIITEGAFTSALDVAVLRYPWLPIRWFMKTRFANLQRADSISEPWLIFHGLDDRVVPFSHAETLAGAAPDAWVIPLEAGHNDGVIGQRAVSIKALQEFSTHVFGDAGR